MDQCPRCRSFCYENFYTHSICHECNYSPELDYTNKKTSSESISFFEAQKFLQNKKTNSAKKKIDHEGSVKQERMLSVCI